jgi:hypothetical protein
MKHRTIKKNAIDKRTKKYKGGQRVYGSNHRILDNNKTKRGGGGRTTLRWLANQAGKIIYGRVSQPFDVSIVKTLNLMFVSFCMKELDKNLPILQSYITRMGVCDPENQVFTDEE